MTEPRTLLVSEIFPPKTGGSGRWFWEIYSRLPRAEYLIAAGEHPEQEAFDTRTETCIHRLPLSFPAWGIKSWSGLKSYFRTIRNLRRLIRRERIGMLHCGRCLPEGFVAWTLRRWLGISYGCFVHGEDVTGAATSRELSWMVRRVFKSASFVIANSRNSRNLLLNDWNLPKEKVHLLHPGVDSRRFTPADPDASIREELGWTNRKVILTVSRLQKRKGHDMLIRALPKIRESVPDVLYAIVGGGEEREPLERLTAELGLREAVRFHGEVDDASMIRCYQQCDLFALPNRTVGSDIEGFGMVLVEAQACGKPVLAGDSGGTAETMHIPETGRIVDCTTPEHLERVIPELLSDPQRLKQMGQAGREWVVGSLDWAVLAEKARALFESIAGRVCS